jgi:hypothetical protein
MLLGGFQRLNRLLPSDQDRIDLVGENNQSRSGSSGTVSVDEASRLSLLSLRKSISVNPESSA